MEVMRHRINSSSGVSNTPLFLVLAPAPGPAHLLPRAEDAARVFNRPDVLNRRSTEQFGAIDSMFAIGAMPDWIPAEIRRASLRGQIHTELSPQEIQNVAQRESGSV